VIDTTFDFRADAGGKDPDSYSATLQRYHRLLWNKPLPGGATFELTMESHRHARVLRHSSELGVFVLSSDTLANSSKGPCRSFYDAMGPEANGTFHGEGGTIGGRLIFPKSQIEGLQSINQTRGTHPRIRDRFDLTLECVRRLYQDEPSPLSATLARYGSYFELFRDFRGYVDFFLLNDLVDPERSSVKFYRRSRASHNRRYRRRWKHTSRFENDRWNLFVRATSGSRDWSKESTEQADHTFTSNGLGWSCPPRETASSVLRDLLAP
jgi:hypothetical protein